jgi:hypothetical protein
MIAPTYINDLHFEHQLWLNEIRFVADEIKIFEKRLGELVSKNTDREMLAELEHFQNQFIRQRESVDILSHELREEDANLAKYAQEHPVAIDRVHFTDHTETREKVDSFRQRYAGLKADFQRFSAKWM